MKGGINKIVRNLNATKGKTDFDKVLSRLVSTLLEIDQGYIPFGQQRAKGEARDL